MEPWQRPLIAVILVALSALMTWKIRSSLKSGVFIYRGRAKRDEQPKWFWAQIAFSTVFVAYTLWFALWILWPQHIPAPYIPCNPRFPSTCDQAT